MPEAPDVEIFTKYFNKNAYNKKIISVYVIKPKFLYDINENELKNWLKGQTFDIARRYGKNLIIRIKKDSFLVMHFGMTGSLQYFKSTQDIPEYSCVIFELDDNHKLSYINRRLIGKIFKISSFEEWLKNENLGPDVLSINYNIFKNIFETSKGAIKNILMDQKKIAGIGNIYSDEILYQSHISPTRKCEELTLKEIEDIYAKTKLILETAVKKEAMDEAMPNNFLLPHRNSDKKCPKGHGNLKILKLGQRTSYYCEKCQK